MADDELAKQKPDSAYSQGMTYFQEGDWQAAIHAFEQHLELEPEDEVARRALQEAQFRAKLDSGATIRPKRRVIRWRAILIRGAIVAVLAILVVGGYGVVRSRVAPLIAESREDRRLTKLEDDAAALLKAGDLDRAEEKYKELLAEVPDSIAAEEGLKQVATAREISSTYDRAVALQQSEDFGGALQLFTEIQLKQPSYRDVSSRIAEVQQQQMLSQLFAEAEADYNAGLSEEALSEYTELKELNVSYQRDLVHQRLFDLNMKLGLALLEQDPPGANAVQQALDYFESALTLEPRDTEAKQERRLALQFLDAQEPYQAGQWAETIDALSTLYAQRPDYLHGLAVKMLYDSYIKSADQQFLAGECYKAYVQYDAANLLPVNGKALARSGLSRTQSCLTPTPTVTATPTSTPKPTSTRRPTRTPVPPTSTPWPLETMHNKILFVSDNPDQPGLWMMDPSGENRQFIGQQYRYFGFLQALQEKEARSPDGNYTAYVADAAPALPQIWISFPPSDQWGPIPPKQITHLAQVSYDPAWSPDGSKIAFVNQDLGSDDIWVVDADGKNPTVLTRNLWEWDKSPSWSPDSTRIVFWSNRSVLKQIYVMQANGQGVLNISNTTWEEYDPIWLK